MNEITPDKISQAGSTFLISWKCPSCRDTQLTCFPFGKCSECQSDWSASPINLRGNSRRVLLAGSSRRGRISKNQIRVLFDIQGPECAYCKADIRTGYHVEHILPIAVGGGNTLSNLCLSCGECNRVAGAFAFGSLAAKREYILNRRVSRIARGAE